MAATTPTGTPAVPQPASPWRRLMCASYEAVLLFGVVWFFGYAFSALVQFKGLPGTARTAFQVYMAVLLGAYFTWFWSNGRRTLPMKTMGVRIVDAHGVRLTTARAAARYVAALAMLMLPLAAARSLHAATILVILLPFAWMLVDARRRTLWDVVAGTEIVRD